MLILSRRPDEEILFTGAEPGDRVSIRVLSIKGKQVRLGIDAPMNVKAHRGEIQHKIDADQAELETEVVNGNT